MRKKEKRFKSVDINIILPLLNSWIWERKEMRMKLFLIIQKVQKIKWKCERVKKKKKSLKEERRISSFFFSEDFWRIQLWRCFWFCLWKEYPFFNSSGNHVGKILKEETFSPPHFIINFKQRFMQTSWHEGSFTFYGYFGFLSRSSMREKNCPSNFIEA